ncbi:3'-5' exonuclease [Halomonas sp.]|uniref:3'-5' exonuclease n=1 Tax=Halomonas sp. TaxID=1486246 RepID=UPI0025C18923|nr:3'-5' exonuclease [Halomonas sp.]
MIKVLRRAVDRRRHANGDYAWLFHPYTGDEMVVINTETIGSHRRNAELASIAAVKVRGDRVLTSESLDLRLVRPASLSGESFRIHVSHGVDLNGGLAPEDALERLLDFVGNRPLLGWRLGIDLAILNRELRPRFGFDLPNATIDVAQSYLRRLRRRHPEVETAPRFEKVAELLDVPLMGRHTALGDAVTTALIYLRLEHQAGALGRYS